MRMTGVLHGVVAFFPGWAWLLCCSVAVLVGAVMRACGIGLAWLDIGSIPQSPDLKRVKSCRKGYMRRPLVIVNDSGFMRYLGLGISSLAVNIHSLLSRYSKSSQTSDKAPPAT